MLKNEAGLWKSVDSWIFKTKDNILIIENTSKTKVSGATSDGKVIQEVFVEGKADQLWKKGKPDAEGYFTIKNSGVPKGELVENKNINVKRQQMQIKLFFRSTTLEIRW